MWKSLSYKYLIKIKQTKGKRLSFYDPKKNGMKKTIYMLYFGK